MNQSMDTKTTPLAQFLKSAIANSGKSHDQIAIEVGYEKGNALQMMADGLIKVAINKIRAIARRWTLSLHFSAACYFTSTFLTLSS